MKPDYSFKLTQRVQKYIEDNNMTRHGDSVIVGLSGGADSVCLFLLLNKLKDYFGIDLYGVHINHCIRGESAARDEKFSYELCEKYGIPFMAYEIDVPSLAKKEGLTVEEAGRNARYACFADYADEIRASKIQDEKDLSIKVAVAHHMDDQAETVIFNMVRGSGITGIGGMEPVSNRGIIRPLLCLTKEEILKYLEFVNQDYCTDETNDDNEYSRNQIRNVVIPALNELQVKSAEHIAMMADDARDIKEFIDSYVEKLFNENVEPIFEADKLIGFRINLVVVKSEKPVIVRELIIMTLKNMIETYKDITKIHITDTYELIFKGKGKMVNLPYGLIAKKEKDALAIYRK